MSLISVIIPVYNEENNLPLILRQLKNMFVHTTHDFEVIFINDGSKDETGSILKDICDPFDNIFYVNLSRNFGQQNALMAGYMNCNGVAAICMDADLQNPVELIIAMIDKWEEGNDIVVCKRKDAKQASGFLKAFTSKVFYKILNIASETSIDSDTPDFRLIDRKVIDVINSLPENDIFLRGIVSWVGFKKVVLEYEHQKRMHGNTNYSYLKMFNLAITAVTGFSVKPLSLAIYAGLFMSLTSTFYIIYAIIRYFSGHTISGWASTIVTISLFGGLQLFVLGILGIYVGKVFMQMKGRPRFIIKDSNLSATQTMKAALDPTLKAVSL